MAYSDSRYLSHPKHRWYRSRQLALTKETEIAKLLSPAYYRVSWRRRWGMVFNCWSL